MIVQFIEIVDQLSITLHGMSRFMLLIKLKFHHYVLCLHESVTPSASVGLSDICKVILVLNRLSTTL